MFLCGQFTTSIDSKNRVRLPAKLKAALGDKYILMPGIDGCIYVMPENDDQTILNLMARGESADPAKENILRTLVSMSSNVEADDQGRFIITPLLKQYANIDKDVQIVGNISKVEIWSKSQWDKRQGAITADKVNDMYKSLNGVTNGN